jgi:putative tryptophan/tyrosine transport system substrate-binding protein
MKMRKALATLFVTLLTSTAVAQTPAKPARIGKLCPMKCDGLPHMSFEDELRKLGWIEGINLITERKEAEGRFERLPELAAQLVRSKPDLLVASSTPGVQAVKRATSQIPIVFSAIGDPVGVGVVQSLARPGGNVTGVTSLVAGTFIAKKFDLIREFMPQAQHVGLLMNSNNPNTRRITSIEVPMAAQQYGFQIDVIEVQVAEDIPGAIAKAKALGVEALAVSGDAILNTPPNRVSDLLAQAAIPAVYDLRATVLAGGLISYGIDVGAASRRQAHLVDRVLRGAAPADIPVEQPTNYELVINLKAATALGLTMPPALLARADEVIE